MLRRGAQAGGYERDRLAAHSSGRGATISAMSTRAFWRLAAIVGAVPVCLLLLSPVVTWAQSPAAASGRGITPSPVLRGLAHLRGAHGTSSSLTLNVDLATRERAQLEELIRAVSTPGSPSYGHYLTTEQYDARFAPTAGERHAVETWLRGLGLHVVGSASDNSLVTVTGSTAAVEHAFGVTVNDYTFDGRDFYANDRDPSVPASLHVDWIGGLSDYNNFQADSADHCVNSKSEPAFCGYFGSDFRTAYDLTGSGEGQSVGFTLWGKSVPQSDYTKYATDTGTTALTVGGAGANGLEFIQVGGASTINAKVEVALDTEVAHAVAPGIHETYWLGVNNTEPTLETALDDAANSKISVISNSWGFACSSVPGGLEKILQAGVSTGKTFYFSSGDNGAEGGTGCPGLSPNVVDVGGTELHVGPSSEWKSENALLDDGGCSNSEARPAWQRGVGSPLEWPSTACSGRAIPDVSADSCYGGRESPKGETFGAECGAFLLVEGSIFEAGGTSLAAPIWAGASAVWDKSNAAAGRPAIGFAAPLLYSLGNDPTTYASDFHDIQTGSNGFAATKGWDEATGWGSPNFNDLANNPADIAYTGSSSGVEGQSAVLSATLDDHGTTHGLEGRKIKFAVGAESCEAATSASGAASCSVTLHDVAGAYSASAKFEGDQAYGAVSTSHAFTVQSAAQPSVSAVEPKEGAEAGGTQVILTGANLSGAKEVKFGATPAKSFKVESASEIAAESPAGKGTVAVTVTTAAGTSASGPGDQFSYLAPPSVSGVEPQEGPEAGGTHLTITGANLSGATQVKFGGTAARSVKVESATAISAESPGGKGTVDVTVTTPGGTSATGSKDEFFYVAPPSVSAIEPNEGPEAGGTPVTVRGADLSGAKEVRFGRTPAKSFKVESASVISAESPAGTGTVGLTVTTAAGTSTTGPAAEFSYRAPPSVTTSAAREITSTSATLTGSVNPNGSEVTECRFEYGTTVLLGSSAACTKLPGSTTSTVEVEAPVTGLEANSPYYFRLLARSAGGVSSGLEEAFTTPASSSPPEFGRCLKVAAEKEAGKTVYDGAFTTATCVTKSETHRGQYEWHPGVVKAGFASVIKPTTTATLVTVKKAKVTCTGETSIGTITGAKTVGHVAITLTGCGSATGKCASPGRAEGELETKTLEGVLGIERIVVKEGKETRYVALDLYPVGKSGPVIEYTCSGAGATTLRGSVLAPVPSDAMHTAATLKFTATSGKQKPERFEGGEQDVLTNTLGEQVGLTFASTQTNEEATEINAFA